MDIPRSGVVEVAMGDKRTFVPIGQAHLAANSRASFAT